MMSACRGRSKIVTLTSSGRTPFAFATARTFSSGDAVTSIGVRSLGAGRDLLHVDGLAGEEHRAAGRQGDHRQCVGLRDRGQRGAVDRVDRDVDAGPIAVADLFAVEEHRGFVLLALADHDRAVHRDGVDHQTHRVDGGLVGGDLVAVADPSSGGEGSGLGDTSEFHGEVAIGSLGVAHGCCCLPGSPGSRSSRDARNPTCRSSEAMLPPAPSAASRGRRREASLRVPGQGAPDRGRRAACSGGRAPVQRAEPS